MKKAISILLAFVLVMSMATSALAARLPEEGRKILFGKISVKGPEAEKPFDYRGARDDERGIVYIHAYDLMDILGAEVVREGEGENCSIHFWVDNWYVELRTESGACVVTYLLESAYGGKTSIPYGRYELDDCLYVEEDDAFYLPFEQMLYLFASSWVCGGGTVYVTRPDTFLDVLAGFDGLFNEVPVYEEMMGEAWDIQLYNAFGLGIGASLDEIDLQFLFDGAISGFLNTSGYQKKAMKDALLLMLMDSPAGEEKEIDLLGGSEAMDDLSTYAGMLGANLEVIGKFEAAEKFVVDVLKSLGNSDADRILSRVMNIAKPGVPIVTYLLSVAQVYSVGSRLDSSLKERMEYLQKTAQRRMTESQKEKEALSEELKSLGIGEFAMDMLKTVQPGTTFLNYMQAYLSGIQMAGEIAKQEDLLEKVLDLQDADERADYFRDLTDVTGEVVQVYFEDTSKAFGKSVNIDTAVGLTDAVIGLIGGKVTKEAVTDSDKLIEKAALSIAEHIGSGKGAAIVSGAGSLLGFASWATGIAAFTAGTFDMAVEMTKLMNPEFRGILDSAESAHTCLNLIYLSNMLKKEFEAAYSEIRTGAFTRETLENAHMSAHLLAVSSLHSHEIMEKLGLWTLPENGYKEPGYITKLINAYAFNTLLMMDEGFVNLESDEVGCVRQDVPISYVRLTVPVMITTESYLDDEEEHFRAEIVRPRVYAAANPDLTQIIDSKIDELYAEKYASLEERKASAVKCGSDMQRHTETLTLTSAYSNGGFVTLSLQDGFFICSIGHDCNETFTYIFDVATGRELEFDSLLDWENASDAKEKFIKLIGDRLIEAGYSDSKAEKIYDEMLKDKVARWDITPQGIEVLIDVMYFDLFGCGVMCIPYEQLEGVLKEEYLPQESAGQMYADIAAYDAAAIGENEVVYTNTPAVSMLSLMGVADHVWVEKGYGRNEVDGGCSYFYAYCPGNSVVTLPQASNSRYGYSVAWIDEAGEHIVSLKAD